jgi:acyl-ACP thioesterase
MLGFGVGDLNTGNASWVLSRMSVELKRLPERGESIDIYTWVSDYGRLFTTRNMTVADESGGRIGAAVTLWAMIDLDTRRPLDLSSLSNRGTSLVDREPPIERPRKVGSMEPSTESAHTVVYSDIDFNGHVGSMKYLEWMIDTLPCDAAAGLSAVRLDINYMHEALPGWRLAIRHASDAAGAHHFDIRDAQGTSICKATITNPESV